MSEIVDADGMVRQIKDVDQSGGTNSPKASVYMAEGTGKALAAVALALGVAAFGGMIVMAILLPSIMRANTDRAVDVAWQADREARILQDRVDRIEIGLGKRGININTDGH